MELASGGTIWCHLVIYHGEKFVSKNVSMSSKIFRIVNTWNLVKRYVSRRRNDVFKFLEFVYNTHMVNRLATTHLLENIINRSRLPWYGAKAVVAALLVLILVDEYET